MIIRITIFTKQCLGQGAPAAGSDLNCRRGCVRLHPLVQRHPLSIGIYAALPRMEAGVSFGGAAVWSADAADRGRRRSSHAFSHSSLNICLFSDCFLKVLQIVFTILQI